MSFLDEVLRELKGRRRDIDRAVTDLEAEIQDRDEKTARIKEQRELIEELMAARTAPLETPTESPKYIVGLDLARCADMTVVQNGNEQFFYSTSTDRNTIYEEFQNWIELQPSPLQERAPEPPPEARQHDKFGTFKYVNGKMVRVCKCELCKKRGIANG